MRKIAEDAYKKNGDEPIDKKRFLAIYMMNAGVRQRLASEYFQILVDCGIFEESLDKKEFNVKVVED